MEADAPAPKIQETQRHHAGHKICGAISSQNRWVVLYSWCYYWKVRCHTTRLVTTRVLSHSFSSQRNVATEEQLCRWTSNPSRCD